MKIDYFRIEHNSYGNIEESVRKQVKKANKVAGCLNNTIWLNMYLKTEVKAIKYKAITR